MENNIGSWDASNKFSQVRRIKAVNVPYQAVKLTREICRYMIMTRSFCTTDIISASQQKTGKSALPTSTAYNHGHDSVSRDVKV